MITRYNNKSYPVTSIEFSMSPKSHFSNSKDERITFVQYYKEKYLEEITDLNQPLIMSLNKKTGR